MAALALAPDVQRRLADAHLITRHVELVECRRCLATFGKLEKFLEHDCEPSPIGERPRRLSLMAMLKGVLLEHSVYDVRDGGAVYVCQCSVQGSHDGWVNHVLDEVQRART